MLWKSLADKRTTSREEQPAGSHRALAVFIAPNHQEMPKVSPVPIFFDATSPC